MTAADHLPDPSPDDLRVADIEERVAVLTRVLADSLAHPVQIPFEALRPRFVDRPFVPGADAVPEEPPRWAQYDVPAPTGWGRYFRRKAYEAARSEARERFDLAQATYERREREREHRLREAKRRYVIERAVQRRRVEAANRRVDDLEAGFRRGDPEAVREYVGLVLSHRELPPGLPTKVHVGYDAPRLFVVFDLPNPEVIPAEAASQDGEIVPRPLRQRHRLYADLICRLVLVRIHDAFMTCPRSLVAEVAVSAHVLTRDEVTGRPLRPSLASVIAPRVQYARDPAHPGEELKILGARISPKPLDLQPVEPLFDPDPVRYRG
jgi:restriction system protein